MLAFAGALLLSAVAPVKVSMPSLSCGQLDPIVCANVNDYVAGKLTRPELELTTSADIAQALGAERQRQLLGCSDDATDCMAELAGALGSEVILFGTVAKFEGRLFVNLRAISSAGKPLGNRALRADDLRGLEREFDRELPGFGDELLAVLRPALLVKRRWFWVPTGLALASAAVGAVLLGLAQSNARQLDAWGTAKAPTREAIHSATVTGTTLQSAAVGLFLGAGAAAVAAVVVWLLEGRPPGPKPVASGSAPTTGTGAVLWGLP